MNPVTSDATGASSTPPAEPPVAAPPAEAKASPARPIGDLSPAERLEWRKTGKIPDATPASSAAPAVEPPAATAATPDPASEPAHDDPDYKPKTAKRIKELLERAERAERALAASQAPPQRTAEPLASPAAAAAPASKLTKPDPEKFDYGTADPAYLEALTDYKVALNEEQREARAEAQRRTSQQETDRARLAENWGKRVDAAKSKHADFEAVALLAPTAIPPGSLVDAWVLESEHGAEVLYHLQKNPADVTRLLGLGPHQQVRELVALEATVTAPPKIVSTAPEPGPVLGARGGDAASASARAVKSGKAGDYIREKNREELAGRKRK